MVQIFDGTSGFQNAAPGNFYGLGVGSARWLIYAQLPTPNGTTVNLATGAGTPTVASDFLGAGNQLGYGGYLNVVPNGSNALVNPAFPSLDRAIGFRLRFQAQVVQEASQADRSGFSVIVLGNDAKGVELSFEGKNPGTSADDFIFVQQPAFDSEDEEKTAAGLFPITDLQTYDLVILGDGYTLSVNGQERLTGSVKAYQFDPATSAPQLPVNPYQIPNLVFLGDDTDTGKSTYTLGPIAVNRAPTATGLGIAGPLVVGATLTGSYTYGDGDGDAQQGSGLQWYRADDGAGTNQVPIAGATNDTYVLTAADLGKVLRFEVTPRDDQGLAGAPAIAATASAIIAPTPTPTPVPTPPPSPVPPPNPVPPPTLESPEPPPPIASPEVEPLDCPPIPTLQRVQAQFRRRRIRLRTINGRHRRDDTLLGGPRSQRLRGLGGNDRLFGNTGEDLLTGGIGNDSLYGGQEDDWLFGDRGDDLLSGDRGNDHLIGGPGADQFAIGAGWGLDEIYDFEPARDRVALLDGLTFADLKVVAQANATLIQVAATGDAIAQLRCILPGQLTPDHFIGLA